MNITTVKTHLHENKKVYIAGAVGVAVGAAAILVLKNGSGTKVTEVMNFKWHSPTTLQTIEVVMPKRGNSGNVIQCVQNGVIYPSQRFAARELGLDGSNLSRHIAGQLPHVKGLTFEKLLDGGS
jgi:hypothetical protein